MEIEIKLGPAEAQVALSVYNDNALLPPCGEEESIVMSTVYYDDRGGNLSSKKQTLRLRKENDRSVCCFKSALQGMARIEVECEAEDIHSGSRLLSQHPDVPAEIAEVLAESTFVPLCETSFTRRTRLCARDGAVFHLCFDHGYLGLDDVTEPLCEIELELCEGVSEVLQTVAAELTRKYGLPVCTQSKQQRAMSVGKTQQ